MAALPGLASWMGGACWRMGRPRSKVLYLRYSSGLSWLIRFLERCWRYGRDRRPWTAGDISSLVGAAAPAIMASYQCPLRDSPNIHAATTPPPPRTVPQRLVRWWKPGHQDPTSTRVACLFATSIIPHSSGCSSSGTASRSHPKGGPQDRQSPQPTPGRTPTPHQPTVGARDCPSIAWRTFPPRPHRLPSHHQLEPPVVPHTSSSVVSPV